MTATGQTPLVTTLRRLMQAPRPRSDERCELCDAPLTGEHAHVLDTHMRRLVCACTACSGGGGRYRALTGRYKHGPSMCLEAAQWDALGIPVGLVFFFHNSRLNRTVACYPGPAGAAESVLPLEAWPALAAANPWIADMAPDVEALLVRRDGEMYKCFIVPVDACFELVGRIRRTWEGFRGGPDAEREIDLFFATLLERSAAHVGRHVRAGGEHGGLP